MTASELADRDCIACTSAEDPLEGDELTELYEGLDTTVWNVVDERILEGLFHLPKAHPATAFLWTQTHPHRM